MWRNISYIQIFKRKEIGTDFMSQKLLYIKYKNLSIKQINKAKKYGWKNNGKLIDKILVIIPAKKEENPKLIEECKKEDIKVIFSEELKKLIFKSIIESIDLKEIFEEMLGD